MRNKEKKELIKRLKKFTIEDILGEERNDPQYISIEKLYNKIKNPLLFHKLVSMNALLAYQLQMKGEKYWESFAVFFMQFPSEKYFPQFLNEKNSRLLLSKLKRFERIKNCINFLRRDNAEYFCENLYEFVKKTAKCLNQKEDAKTIVFAAKMYLYSCRIVYKKDYIAPQEIFIPIDSRIGKISEDKDFWKEVAKETNLPLLHIDTILWLDKL